MSEINIVFPHQLFRNSVLLNNDKPIYLVEEYLFFRQYAFHKQKIAFHRASMKAFEAYLKSKGKEVIYVESISGEADIRLLIPALAKMAVDTIHFIDPVDDWLSRRLLRGCKNTSLKYVNYESPLFLNTTETLSTFFSSKKNKFFQTKFYISQRKRLDILLEDDGQPLGGKWSFDAENRKKYPRKKIPPAINYPKPTAHYEEAFQYVEKYYPHNPGEIGKDRLYPIDYKTSWSWFQQFLEMRFAEFGPYEDAIVKNENVLHHSVLTPILNVGLINVKEVVEKTIHFARKNDIPINSLEGFIRQIIGWREFIRGLYVFQGVRQRTTNYWKFKRKIPTSFYNGNTGIDPIDITIRKVLKTGYCHHIERLMVLGNFMLLCEFDPDEVYRWFMEMFIDAYDWVMVPNIYGMSQFADGGLMATKPYISGSNYLMKMSDYKKGSGQNVWDGLFWRFMDIHRAFFLQNPRLGMLVRMLDKMPSEKRQDHFNVANMYLNKLDVQLSNEN